jgi:N6-adenosine-specific RNA methylase IME4
MSNDIVSTQKITALTRALEQASEPPEIRKVEIAVEHVEQLMHEAGLYEIEEIRPVNELRMRARWKLGRALKKIERRQGARTDNTSEHDVPTFRAYLKGIGLIPEQAKRAQRIGALPPKELDKVLVEGRRRDPPSLLAFIDLMFWARPYWHQEKRKDTHRRIVRAAATVHDEAPDAFGPFPLIYADPPWIFETHTPEMTHRMPEDHYPTLPDGEIIGFKVGDLTMAEIAHTDSSCFMWCTSSNLKRGIAVLEGWGFEYKTHAMWDKEMIGLGLIFRNQHEVLLYGSRGNPPKPIELVSSVFRYARTTHSAKPPEVRAALERMYPFYDAATRVELFARGQIEGWTCAGYEANRSRAA